jgi:phosphoribosyl-dephospho-CoA transferase
MADPALGARCDVRRLRRHHLVWVAPDHHPALAGAVTDPALREAVAALLAAGSPLVVRRQPPLDGASSASSPTLALGMPLPPAQGRQRLAFAVPATAIVRGSPPPRLADAIPNLRTAWRAPLTDLACEAQAAGIELRLFGSAAWEALTGRPYLTENSDIDLIWRPVDADEIDAGIALLLAWESDSGLSADGEILFGDDAAVAWREWARIAEAREGAQRVLVKTLYGPRICAAPELTAQLPRHRPVRAAAAAIACA